MAKPEMLEKHPMNVVEVKAALEKIRFNAVSGTITLDKQHNPVKAAVIISVKDGEKKFLASVSP